MSQESPIEDALSLEEPSEVLAGATDATGSTAEEIEQGATEAAIGPPWEVAVVGFGDPGPLDEPDDSE